MIDTAIVSESWDSTGGTPTPRATGPLANRSIVLVGGGTAGWMTALILARTLIARGVEIMLLESPAVPTIGVGEGSTPWLRGFFEKLGIEEAEVLEAGDLGPAAHELFNRSINEVIEEVRDYVVTHYKTNTRIDTEYRRANAAIENICNALKQLCCLWTTGTGIGPGVLKQTIGKGYPLISWYL
jgi:hypothetical protein